MLRYVTSLLGVHACASHNLLIYMLFGLFKSTRHLGLGGSILSLPISASGASKLGGPILPIHRYGHGCTSRAVPVHAVAPTKYKESLATL